MDYSKSLPSSSSSESSYGSMLPPRSIPTTTIKIKKRTKPFTVLVEGNVGAGKTTFLDYFARNEQYCSIFPEPVVKWRDYNGINLLVCTC